MKIYEKFYLFLKKNLSPKSKNFFISFSFKNNLKINFPKFIFKFLKTNIYDEKKKFYVKKLWWFYNFKRV